MAAILAGLVTYYFNRRLRASNAQHGMTQIVAAANELPAGMPLTTKDVALVDWPSNLPLPGSFSKVEEVLLVTVTVLLLTLLVKVPVGDVPV